MNNFKRKITRTVYVGNVPVGGGFPIPVQSMTTAKTHDLKAILPQIEKLEAAGCQIIRVTVPDEQALKALPEIKKRMTVPLVADIHFDYRLALGAIDAGADKIRINPGNIGGAERVKVVLAKARAAHIPIRIGVNSGSLEKDLRAKYGGATPEAMLESARRHLEICEENDFRDVIVALKSSEASLMIAANRLFSEKYDYPLHLGVTEAGPVWSGTIKSAIGIGTLLAEGIGDTLRVSLTADPVEEVRAGFEILKALNLTKSGIRLVSCPTCGRTSVNLIEIVNEVESKIRDLPQNLTVAVMGCEVNGPGEARSADL
ncbi:MAG TPA: flavodoxin-dependent (E)-4-hydroxy-3-methylbut-2-enyl-diphosphate synthase, partial [Candidatus Marinimicrobia bacterium]|nr:flavodoxin-dependent (E)-4-hydroxy-3-methylbut-2-enyl-diphosphate synthase [Candidatus Neomarinimicrobiota bacterium]HQK12177.1 flavodoxin-dependent (E)-4-hydroxy-3-methylbut-2-enyl-diphosphate synthase [Candidatus Neomarinimicrobiota bacterium]